MKTVLLVSFLLLPELHRCLDLFLEIPASWMIAKIHFKSCQTLHTSGLTFYVVETKMEAYVLVYLEYFRSGKL